jgi:hypothetical protein
VHPVGEPVVMPGDDAAVTHQRGRPPYHMSGFREGIESLGDCGPAALRLRRVHRREGEQKELNECEAKNGAPDARGGGSPGRQRE